MEEFVVFSTSVFFYKNNGELRGGKWNEESLTSRNKSIADKNKESSCATNRKS